MVAYAIIGVRNTRKSSVARSLTGCYNRNVRDILLINGQQIQIYVRVASLQESRTTPQEFLDEIQQSGCHHAMFCLWPHAHPTDPEQFPDAAAYFAQFELAHLDIAKVALLGQAHPPVLHPDQAFFPDSRIDPVNQTALEVRTHFEWY